MHSNDPQRCEAPKSLNLGSQSFERHKHIARRLGLLAPAFTVAFLHVAAFAQAPSSARPSTTFNDPVAAALCLAGQGCAGPPSRIPGSFESAPAKDASSPVERPACAAEETLKAAPPALKAEALAFARSDIVARCRKAVIALAPERDAILAAVNNGVPSLGASQIKAAQEYAAACFTPRIVQTKGPITPAERQFLHQHVGLIVSRPAPDRSKIPICAAVRLGRFVITAERCIPAYAKENPQPGGYLDQIGFRFFSKPTVYGLALLKFGAAIRGPGRAAPDFAILEIIDAPELDEVVEPLVGEVRLFDDFITASASVNLRVLRQMYSGDTLDFSSAVQVRSNTLCRAAHITPDGLFLHSCFAEGILDAGTPLFQRQRGQLVFVGFHEGETSTLQDPSLASCARGLPKVGVAVLPGTLTRGLWQ